MKTLVVVAEGLPSFGKRLHNVVVESDNFEPDCHEWVDKTVAQVRKKMGSNSRLIPISFVPLGSFSLNAKQWLVSAWSLGGEFENSDHFFGIIRINERDPKVQDWEDLIERFVTYFSGPYRDQNMAVLSLYPVGNVVPGEVMPILVLLKEYTNGGFHWRTIKTDILLVKSRDDSPNFISFKVMGFDPYSEEFRARGFIPVTTIPLSSFQDIAARRLIFGICVSCEIPEIVMGYVGVNLNSGKATVSVPLIDSVLESVSNQVGAESLGVWSIYPVF